MFMIPPLPPPPPALVGPPPPAIQAPALAAASFSIDHATGIALRDTSGAVVVVEDVMPRIPPGLVPPARSPEINVGLTRFAVRFSPDANQYGPLFVDAAPVIATSGPNERVYPIGWGF